MQSFLTKPYHINDTIFKEGSIGRAAYILKEGCVEISLNAEGKKTVLALLKPPSVFGEMALLRSDHKRIATATAVEYTELVEIRQEDFEKFIDSSQAFIKTVLTALAERLRHANAKIIRIPDIFIATSEILNLLFEHGNATVQYDLALSAIASALSLDQKVIREQLVRMEQLNLIETVTGAGGEKGIRSTEESFLPRAMKIREVLLNFSSEKEA